MSNDPTTCYQCSNVAMYLAGQDQNIPLCLDCYFKVAQIQQQQVENSERMVNYLQDHMASVVGLPPIGARFPARPRPTIINGATLHNITVSNSVVGTINTGSIGSIDQSITALGQLGQVDLGKRLRP